MHEEREDRLPSVRAFPGLDVAIARARDLPHFYSLRLPVWYTRCAHLSPLYLCFSYWCRFVGFFKSLLMGLCFNLLLA